MTRRSFVLGAIGVGAQGAGTGLGTIVYLHDQALWIRDLPEAPRRLASAAGLNTPRLSTSGKWVSYIAGDAQHVVAAFGGTAQRLGRRAQLGRDAITFWWRDQPGSNCSARRRAGGGRCAVSTARDCR